MMMQCTPPGPKLILVLQASGVWLLLLAVAIVNGGIREHFIEKHVSPLVAHQLSTLLLCLAIFTVSAVFIYKRRITRHRTLLAIGLFWAMLTIIFEISFFHFIGGIPLSQLLADYNLLEGRLFLLVIMTTTVSPVIAGRLFALRGKA